MAEVTADRKRQLKQAAKWNITAPLPPLDVARLLPRFRNRTKK